jgi:bifunctional UDP-N-acetylglucosamine pyrophosphorylase/glucosamine-1-phosphate N-acetyltransferase
MVTRIVILAAGKGRRMMSDVPKVLHDLSGRPIISHLADSVLATGIDTSPVVVISKDGGAIREVLGNTFTYVIQDEQLGTGHAVRCAEEVLKNTSDSIIVLYGDQPFVKPETIVRLKNLQESSNYPMAMMTVKVPDFDDWRANFYDFGRVVRDAEGNIIAIIEKKDATLEQLEIKEVNPSFFSFRADWLWEHLKMLGSDNAQKEYYLTDLVKQAIDGGEKIASCEIDAKETVGVNTPEQLEFAEKLIA